MSFDPTTLQHISLLSFLLVFVGGLLTSLGPCNIAVIPLIIGFVGGKEGLSRWRSFQLSLAFVIGLAATFMLLGVSAALIGGLIGAATNWWYYLVALICFVVGLNMLGVLNIPIPMWFGGLRERVSLKGVPGAFLLGLVSGLVASQCATPALAAILTYVMSTGAIVYGALLLFVYALGRGVPVLLAGTFTGIFKRIQRLSRWSIWLEKASGVIIIGVGLYFLWIA
ncbi:MAG: sulfite exporter TauE/SafE family protein [Anaerolineaceae bacterium]|nr:sulfite exporter TauE/SafE family protein [Anaerolineaceae bacterium]